MSKPAELKRRTTTLIALIAVHGLVKVCHAAMASRAGIRQCASKTAPRCIANETLILATYRLNDPLVWESKGWQKIVKAEAAEQKRKTKVAAAKAKANPKPKTVRRKPVRSVRPPAAVR